MIANTKRSPYSASRKGLILERIIAVFRGGQNLGVVATRDMAQFVPIMRSSGAIPLMALLSRGPHLELHACLRFEK